MGQSEGSGEREIVIFLAEYKHPCYNTIGSPTYISLDLKGLSSDLKSNATVSPSLVYLQ